MLRDPEVVSDLNILQEQYVVCSLDKAASNIAFICKKYYVQVLTNELDLLSATSNTYQQVLFIIFCNNKIILLILFLD